MNHTTATKTVDSLLAMGADHVSKDRRHVYFANTHKTDCSVEFRRFVCTPRKNGLTVVPDSSDAEDAISITLAATFEKALRNAVFGS